MNYNWVLLDADNTIWDFDASEKFALAQALEDIGGHFTDGVLDTYHGINKQCWRDYEDGKMTKDKLRTIRFERFLHEMNMDSDPVAFSKAYLGYLGSTNYMVDGANDLLDTLASKVKMAMVTNGLTDVQRPRIEHTKVAPYFEAIVISDEIGHYKPQASFFEYTFDQINQPNKNGVLMVGDNLNSDIKGGRDYGLDTCWFNPHAKAGDETIKPTFTIQRLEELATLVLG